MVDHTVLAAPEVTYPPADWDAWLKQSKESAERGG